VANVVQSEDSLLGIKLLISVIPAIAALMAIAVFRFYSIDEQLLERIQMELSVRKKGETR